MPALCTLVPSIPELQLISVIVHLLEVSLHQGCYNSSSNSITKKSLRQILGFDASFALSCHRVSVSVSPTFVTKNRPTMYLGARVNKKYYNIKPCSPQFFHKKTDSTTAAVKMMLSQFNVELSSRRSGGVKENSICYFNHCKNLYLEKAACKALNPPVQQAATFQLLTSIAIYLRLQAIYVNAIEVHIKYADELLT